jgi:hypothetical protein
MPTAATIIPLAWYISSCGPIAASDPSTRGHIVVRTHHANQTIDPEKQAPASRKERNKPHLTHSAPLHVPQLMAPHATAV